MARIFVTGSSTGLGLLAGQRLAREGHAVVLHARNERRADDARQALRSAEDVIVGDLQTIRGAVDLAEKANALGRFDAVIHNAGVYDGGALQTEDGLPAVFAVNALAPYILTALMIPPERLVYLSSSMHSGADLDLDDLSWKRREWNVTRAYSESKLLVLLLAFAAARLRPDAYANAVDPGWVPTRMGGSGATDDLDKGAETQAVLAAPAADSPLADASGEYFHHLRAREPDARARDTALQDEFLGRCTRLSGITIDPAQTSAQC
jgi:NAD(P)-dependent dehydrogenase (short-subunit alcohol dehydrogenase family)